METKRFELCSCGSESLIYGDEAKKLVADGKAPEDFIMVMARYESVIANEQMKSTMKVGDKLPVVITYLDACGECGIVRVVRVDTDVATKQNRPAPLSLPPNMNRQQRRHLDLGRN